MRKQFFMGDREGMRPAYGSGGPTQGVVRLFAPGLAVL